MSIESVKKTDAHSRRVNKHTKRLVDALEDWISSGVCDHAETDLIHARSAIEVAKRLVTHAWLSEKADNDSTEQ